MKIAVFGDVHANLEALTAVLNDAAALGVAQFICTGDLVGYHANPRECIRIIRDMGCPVVMGNHDEEAARDDVIYGMNPLARTAMEWTRGQLSPEDKTWLQHLPFTRRFPECTVVHASLDEPRNWVYVLNRFDAWCSFAHQQTPVCFNGHTHQPRFFVMSGGNINEPDTASPLHLDPGAKYFVNTGSVGFSRDGDRRACYAIYDTAQAEVALRRIPWDYGSFEHAPSNTPMWPLFEARRGN